MSRRLLALALGLALAAGAAFAADDGMLLGIGRKPGASGGGCSNTLDLSQTCNLVYYRVVTR